MAFSLVQSADFASSAKGTSHTIAWPGATVAGNLLLLFVDFNEEAVVTSPAAPAGWTLAVGPVEHQSTSNPQIKGAIYYKQNASSQSGNVTVTLDQSRHCRLHLHEWSGGVTSGVLDVVATNHGSSTTLDSGTSGTTSQANELWVGLLACKNVNPETIVASAGWSQLSEVGQSSGAGGAGRSGVYRKLASATGTSNIQATISVSADWVGMTVTFKQAGAAPSLVQLTSNGAAGLPASLYGGVGNRTNSNNNDLAASMAKYPNIDLACFYVGWATLEPNAPLSITQTSGMNWTNFESAIQSAISYGKRILLRIECGFRSPPWLFTTSIQPCTKLFLVDDNGNTSASASPSNIHIPLPWTSNADGTPNANLVAHYTRLMKEVQKEMIKPDGHGGLIGDHVYFVAVSMPTTVGTEQSMGYQSATTFAPLVYDGPAANVSGPSATFKTINHAEWDRYGTETNRRVWWLDAWDKAADVHMAVLTAVPSSVAYGTSFGAFSDQPNRATTMVGKYGLRICHMVTDLQVASNTGTFAQADAPGAATLLAVKNAGGWVGFQAATESRGYPPPNTNIRLKAATDDLIATYAGTFFEPADPLLADGYAAATDGSGWGGIEDLQARILAQQSAAGGGGSIISVTTPNAIMTITTPSAISCASDKYERTVAAGGLGTADIGGAYTLTGTAGDFSVNGHQASVAITAAAQVKTATLGSVVMDDCAAYAQFQTDTLPAGSFTAFDHRLRAVDASNYYRIRAFLNTNGTITLRISSVIAGVVTTIAGDADTGLTVQTGNDYTLLASAIGTSPTVITAYLYDSSSPPPNPVPWQLSTSDSSAALQVVAPIAWSGTLNSGSTATGTHLLLAEYSVFPTRLSSTDCTVSLSITPDALLSIRKLIVSTGKTHTPRS